MKTHDVQKQLLVTPPPSLEKNKKEIPVRMSELSWVLHEYFNIHLNAVEIWVFPIKSAVSLCLPVM